MLSTSTPSRDNQTKKRKNSNNTWATINNQQHLDTHLPLTSKLTEACDGGSGYSSSATAAPAPSEPLIRFTAFARTDDDSDDVCLGNIICSGSFSRDSDRARYTSCSAATHHSTRSCSNREPPTPLVPAARLSVLRCTFRRTYTAHRRYTRTRTDTRWCTAHSCSRREPGLAHTATTTTITSTITTISTITTTTDTRQLQSHLQSSA